MDLHNKIILITGGTGSFGNAIISYLLNNCSIEKIIILSRDEYKQYQLMKKFDNSNKLRFFIGDVRDLKRLLIAFRGVDIVFHAAALKQVPSCEYNPFEAVKTNIMGGQNVIQAAIANKVKKVIAISSDKASNPINLYGATKLVSDKLFTAGNSYSGKDGPKYAVVRYGNVMGSRGSVVPLFYSQKEKEHITVTDKRMTRFWITLEQVVQFVLKALFEMKGGEIFIPKIPSIKITDLAKAIAPNIKIKEIGIRPGEKLHESMISAEDSIESLDMGDYYIIKPTISNWETGVWKKGIPLKEGFIYASNTNDCWLNVNQIKTQLEKYYNPDY